MFDFLFWVEYVYFCDDDFLVGVEFVGDDDFVVFCVVYLYWYCFDGY